MRKGYKILLGKPEGKRSLERPKGKRVDDVKKDNKEIGCEDVGCIHLTRDRTVC
jgi:hypothetical protein